MAAIFLKQGDELAAMVEEPYEAEDVLQRLIADYPNLLAGDQDDGPKNRWLLVRREVGVASDEGGGNRWSLDHLFLDQDGVPTLVEVKRSSDTRIRREVVGQLLDYAANGSVVWDRDTIRGSFESRVIEEGGEPDEVLNGFLGTDADADAFWEMVGTNLTAGRLRLVFVADEIPSELRRVVEFLNEQMTRTEVLALEVKQYKEQDGDRITLVPRLLGQTEAARQVKGRKRPSGKPAWDEESYEAAIRKELGAGEAERVMKLYRRLRDHGTRIYFGSGGYPSMNLWLGESDDPSESLPVALSFYPTGVAINLDFVRDKRPEEGMERLVRLIREIPGVSEYFVNLEQTSSRWGMRPTMSPSRVLPDDAAVEVFAEKIIEATQPMG
jgi:hypothetical protein